MCLKTQGVFMDEMEEGEPYKYFDHLTEKGLSPDDITEIFRRYLDLTKESTVGELPNTSVYQGINSEVIDSQSD
jgi:hypothetical protein